MNYCTKEVKVLRVCFFAGQHLCFCEYRLIAGKASTVLSSFEHVIRQKDGQGTRRVMFRTIMQPNTCCNDFRLSFLLRPDMCVTFT